ncbi:FAD/NAD(P)-binding domain-containing protein [Ophiobolus disseminans]|uniref:FAD/NAD(P)-binding domain-containing protein n=1 Tax=Ophiobolus disseminans TaxID=1469910 RepID=A0A6A7AKG9_9PLEO|nr:FAD/NAD(P)-binding domain-containing protein [Ophiobolus disseminans]
MTFSNGNTNGAAANGTSNATTSGIKNPTSPSPLPLIIAGGGCVGLFLALLLTHSPIPHPIIVLEPQTPDPASTRAMAHQPPTYPIISRVPGLLPELVAAGSLSSGLCFRTSVANGSKVIAGKTFDNSGEGTKGKGQLLLPQGKFQEILVARLAGKADVRIGSSVTSFSQSSSNGSVTVTIQTPSGAQEHIKATYLIGADGAHSLMRKHLGVAFEGETLDAQLVATDLYFPFHDHGFFDANFIIDPTSYGLIGRISKPATQGEKALWRVSYGVPLGLSEEEVKNTVDEKLATMLPNQGLNAKGKKEYEVVRIAPYKAQQLLATTLHENRVCLVGDAAHLTNPYAGLGLASGMADASSLAEVLAHILTGQAQDATKLLGSWSSARRQKFYDVVDKPSRMAYKRVRSDVSTDEKLGELLSRDPMVGALKKGMPVMPPSLETRGEELGGW